MTDQQDRVRATVDLEEVQAGVERLYQADFYGRAWLATWAAQVGTLCTELAERNAELKSFKRAARAELAERDQLRREVEAMRGVLSRLRQWDHLDAASDGPYWKREIVAALDQAQPKPEQSQHYDKPIDQMPCH